MGYYDVFVSVPGNDPSDERISRSLSIIKAESAEEVLKKLEIRVYSHEKKAFVYEGLPGVVWVELRKANFIVGYLCKALEGKVENDFLIKTLEAARKDAEDTYK